MICIAFTKQRPSPHEPTDQYEHNKTGEDNADAHLKRQVMGREVVIAITNGDLILDHGNKYSTVSLMEEDQKEFLSS